VIGGPARVSLVTGASGFLGAHVCRAWAASGRAVRGLYRRPPLEPIPGVEAAICAGLDDRAGLRAALVGVNTVVHLAARVHVMHDTASDPLGEFRRVNVEGTRVLLEEAIAAGVERFVFVSSIKAMGEASDELWTEATPARPVDPYGVSKLEAELLVREVAGSAGLHAPILRLPLMYGPGVGANMLRLFQLVDRGLPLPFGAVRNRRSLAYVGNVVGAIDAVLATPAAGAEVFLVSDGKDFSTPELIRAIARALARPARLVPVPVAVFRGAASMGDLLDRVGRSPLTSASVQRLLGSLAFDASKLSRVTGYRPAFSPEQGLDVTARWYRQRAA
jgi:nucleoside-diphosphate-sugar epimerase